MEIKKIHKPHFSIVAPAYFDDALTPTELSAKMLKTTNELVQQVNENTSTIETLVGGNVVNEINGIIPDEDGKVVLGADDIEYSEGVSIADELDTLNNKDENNVKQINEVLPIDGVAHLDGDDMMNGGRGNYYTVSDSVASALQKVDTQVKSNNDNITTLEGTQKFYFAYADVPTTASQQTSFATALVKGNNLKVGDIVIGKNGYVGKLIGTITSNSVSVEGLGVGLDNIAEIVVNKLLYLRHNISAIQGDEEEVGIATICPRTDMAIGDYVLSSNGQIGIISDIDGSVATITSTGYPFISVAAAVKSVNSTLPDQTGNVNIGTADIAFQATDTSRDLGQTVYSALNTLNGIDNLVFVNIAVPVSAQSPLEVASVNQFYPAPRGTGYYVVGNNGYIGQIVAVSNNNYQITGTGAVISATAQVQDLIARMVQVETRSSQNSTSITSLKTVDRKNTKDVNVQGTIEEVLDVAVGRDVQIFVADWSEAQYIGAELPEEVRTSPCVVRFEGTTSADDLVNVVNITITAIDSVQNPTAVMYVYTGTAVQIPAGGDDWTIAGWAQIYADT